MQLTKDFHPFFFCTVRNPESSVHHFLSAPGQTSLTWEHFYINPLEMTRLKNKSCFSSVLVTFLILFIGSLPGNVHGDPNMQRLMSDLKSSSSKDIRPMKNYNDTMTVALYLKLQRIVDLDFKQDILTTQVTMEQVWNNYLMRWDESAYGGIKEIVFPATELWVPDLALMNYADGKMFFDRGLVKVFFTGYVEWKSTAILKSICQLRVRGFPNDEHNCTLKFGSWIYDGDQLDIQQKGGRLPETQNVTSTESGNRVVTWESPSEVDRTEYMPSTDWDLVKSRVVMTHNYYNCCPESHQDVSYHLTVRRRPGSWVKTTILPWIFLTLLPLLVFLIPTQSEQKVTFVVLNFLALLILIFPSSSNDSKLIFMTNCYAFTLILDFLIVSSTVFVIFVHNRTFQMPKLLKDFVAGCEKITCGQGPNRFPPQQQNKKASLAVIDEDPSPGLDLVAKHLKEQDDNESVRTDWNTLASILDRIFLCIFTVASVSGIIALC